MDETVLVAVIAAVPGVLVAVIGIIAAASTQKRTHSFELERLRATNELTEQEQAHARMVEVRDMYQRALKVAIEYRDDPVPDGWFDRIRDVRAWIYLLGSPEVIAAFESYFHQVELTDMIHQNEGLAGTPGEDWSEVETAFGKLAQAMKMDLDQVRKLGP